MKKRLVSVVVVFLMVISFVGNVYAAADVWNKGAKINFTPSVKDKEYYSSPWTKDLVELYQVKWYENPKRSVLKGELMLVQLRAMQASLERRGLPLLSAGSEKLQFKDLNTLTKEATEEAKILKSLGILSGSTDGYMKLNNNVTRAEAAKILIAADKKMLKITPRQSIADFDDIQNHWAWEPINLVCDIGLLNGVSKTKFSPNTSLTIEQILQILENEVGYSHISRADVIKAMQQTFKVKMSETKIDVVKLYEKSNFILPRKGNLVTNQEKWPSNFKEYPFFLDYVNPKVYEISNKSVDTFDYGNALEIYPEVKDHYDHIDFIVGQYLSTILNVDYTNLDEEQFTRNLDEISIFKDSKFSYNNYFNYVRKNKIQISGTYEIQYPAIYFDGRSYRVRTKINLTVKNASEPYNLLFKDLEMTGSVKYDGKNFERILDIPMSLYFNVKQFGIYVAPLTLNPNPYDESKILPF